MPASTPNVPSPGSLSTVSTEETRPPYSAAKPPDCSSTRSTMSALKTEKMPPRWNGLKMGTSSRRMRFWSAEPPRTLNAAEKSDTVVTPGSTSMARSGSDSAMMGSDFSAAASISCTVIPADSSKRVLARLRSASTVMPAITIACEVIATSTSVPSASTLTCSRYSWKPIRVTLSMYAPGSRSRKAKKPSSSARVYSTRVESETGLTSASAPSTGRPSSDRIRPLS